MKKFLIVVMFGLSNFILGYVSGVHAVESKIHLKEEIKDKLIDSSNDAIDKAQDATDGAFGRIRKYLGANI